MDERQRESDWQSPGAPEGVLILEKHRNVLLVLLVGAKLLLSACGKQPSKQPDDDQSSVDTEPPEVEITSAASASTSSYKLTGIAIVYTAIDSLTYNLNGSGDNNLTVDGNRFETDITLQAGNNSIAVTATDTAGNKESDSITVTYGAPASDFSIDTDIAAHGDTVTVTGQNLGSSGTINIGDTSAAADSWTDTEITFTIPGDAAAGPQQLQVTAGAGTEQFDIFIGVDFPQGTIEQLAAENHPRGTAVRLG